MRKFSGTNISGKRAAPRRKGTSVNMCELLSLDQISIIEVSDEEKSVSSKTNEPSIRLNMSNALDESKKSISNVMDKSSDVSITIPLGLVEQEERKARYSTLQRKKSDMEEQNAERCMIVEVKKSLAET